MRTLLKTGRILAAAAVVIAVILLAWQCLDLYAAGTGSAAPGTDGLPTHSIYTREAVAQRLDLLSVPLAVCAAAAAVSVILHAAVGSRPETPLEITPENRLRLIKARIAALPEAALREERLRRRLNLIFGGAMGLLGLYCLRYLLDRNSFPDWTAVAPDAVMGTLLLRILPPCALALLLGIALSFLRKTSTDRELALLQGLPKEAPAAPRSAAPSLAPVRILLYALALLFILLGVMNGGLRDVLYKAINICTECIGLG